MAPTNDAKRRRTQEPDGTATYVSPQKEQTDLQRMIETLRTSLDANEVKGICQKLRELCDDSNECFQEVIVDEGGIDAVISSMWNHLSNAQTLVACLELLTFLVNEAFTPNAKDLVSKGTDCIIYNVTVVSPLPTLSMSKKTSLD